MIDWAKPELIWFIVGLIFLLAEFIIPGFVIFFFGAGAWIVALIALFFNVPLNFQLLIFLLSSVFLLIFLRKQVTQIFIGRQKKAGSQDDNIDEFKGENATVIEEIVPGKPGKVEFHGSQWKAESDDQIAAGKIVEIISTKSITLKVKPVEGSK